MIKTIFVFFTLFLHVIIHFLMTQIALNFHEIATI